MGGESKNGKVPLISKIAYGFGDVGCNFSWMFVNQYGGWVSTYAFFKILGCDQ